MSEITKQSLSELVENIKSKKLSSSEVTKAFVERSEKSKELNAYITEDYANALNKAKKFDENDTNRENMYYNLQEKSDAKYMFMVSIKDIKAGEELCANYNLYTYPKTGVGIQML